MICNFSENDGIHIYGPFIICSLGEELIKITKEAYRDKLVSDDVLKNLQAKVRYDSSPEVLGSLIII